MALTAAPASRSLRAPAAARVNSTRYSCSLFAARPLSRRREASSLVRSALVPAADVNPSTPSQLLQQQPVQARRSTADVRCQVNSRRRRVAAAAAPPASEAAAEALQQGPALSWQHPETGTQIQVFGVEHLGQESHIGEYILQRRPQVVLVETAATPQQGSTTGATLSCRDQVPGAAGFFVRVFCGLAAELQGVGLEAWLSSTAWQQAAGSFNGEQLAYVAALTVGATLAFADRPKGITYRRLATLPTLSDLDQAYTCEVAAQYAAALATSHPQLLEEAQAALAGSPVWRIMMQEREVVMCGAVDAACKGAIQAAADATPSSTTETAAAAESPADHPKLVVLVVGAAHLPGLEALWTSGDWKQQLGAPDLPSSPLMQAPPTTPTPGAAPAPDGAQGLHRGLLSAVLQLSVPPEVLQDLEEQLPPLPEAEEEHRQGVFEVYSSHRMQLACLPKQLLPLVCGSVKGVDLEEDVLQPLRQLRPVNGGPGWSEEVVMQLRGLNFDLEPEE